MISTGLALALAICGPKTHAFLPGFGEVLRVDVQPMKLNVMTQVDDFHAEWSTFAIQGLTVSENQIIGEGDIRYLELTRDASGAFAGYVILNGLKIDLICR